MLSSFNHKFNFTPNCPDVRRYDCFQLMRRHQQRQGAGAREAGAGEAGMDLAGYLEFQQSYKALCMQHKAVLKSNRGFW
jgi:hypothetical protein